MESIAETPTQVAIAVVEHAGKFLVGVRPAGKPLAGFAEFPGGKVEADETPQQAAIRECLEESGLRIEIVEEYFSTRHQYTHGLLEVHFFQCRLTAHQTKTSSEANIIPLPPFRWVSIDELATLDFPAANSALTEMLLDRHAASATRRTAIKN